MQLSYIEHIPDILNFGLYRFFKALVGRSESGEAAFQGAAVRRVALYGRSAGVPCARVAARRDAPPWRGPGECDAIARQDVEGVEHERSEGAAEAARPRRSLGLMPMASAKAPGCACFAS